MTGQAPLLQVDGLVRDYPLPRRSLFRPMPAFRALHGVGFTVEAVAVRTGLRNCTS